MVLKSFLIASFCCLQHKMNSNQFKCCKCQGPATQEQLHRYKCGHYYCNKCLEQITYQGGADCSFPGCKEFLNIGDLMNREFQKHTNANQMIFGTKIQQPKPKPANQTQTKVKNNPQLKSPSVQGKFDKSSSIGPKQPQPPNQNTSPQLNRKDQFKQPPSTRPQQFSKSSQPKQQTVNPVLSNPQNQSSKQLHQNQNQQPAQHQNGFSQTSKQSQQQQVIQSSFLCDYCKISNDMLYHNEICSHRLCYDCLKNNYEKYCVCFVAECGWQINQEQLNQFMKTIIYLQNLPEPVQELRIEKVPSNIYEDPSAMLVSKVPFEEVSLEHTSIRGINEFIRLFDEFKISQKLFTDYQFPPNQKSLGPNYQCLWARVKDIFQGDCQFFSKSQGNNRFGLGKWIGPKDIVQGQLGNCYLLASISSLGNRRPDVLLNNFITQTLNDPGIYCVRLCLDGSWTAVFVDDYFPTSNGRPIFTKAMNNAIWVMVLEKAWAKLFGSYQDSAAGSMQEALRCLTAAPTEIIWTASPDFYKQLKRCLESRTIMVAATQSQDQQPSTQGLLPNHAYTVLKIRAIEHPKRGYTELIKLRNPWGRHEWCGDWGQDSILWTPELRKALKLDEDDSGVFYMDLGSFVQQFRDIHVCYLRENGQYSSSTTQTSRKHATYYSITVKTKGEYFISVVQKNQRFKGNPNYSPAKLLVARKIGNGYSYVGGKMTSIYEMWCRCTLEAGEYVILAKVSWQMHEKFTFTTSVYGPEKVELRQITKVQGLLRSVFLEKALLQEGKRTYAQMGQPNISSCYNLDRLDGWGYYLIDNQSTVTLNARLHFSRFLNLKFCKPHRGQSLAVELPPKQQFLAVIKVLDGYQFEYTQKVSFL